MCIAEWCCMCKNNGETMDHLLLHCAYVHKLWSLVLSMFGLQWVLPRRVVDLLAFDSILAISLRQVKEYLKLSM